MSLLKGKKVIIGISGGIAAYKTAQLIRCFIKSGAEVKVVVTTNALQFITETTLSTLSKNIVYSDLFEKSNSNSVNHISITDWADFFVVAPATANIIGKYANGIADDALSTILLAFDKDIYIAPAMNSKMYMNCSVQRNISYLKSNDVHFIEPVVGDLACGYEGIGKMDEPENIYDYILNHQKKNKEFENHKVLVTAGPTYEKIDPVRFIGNMSSGLMGFCIAEEYAKRGADVTLITGPSNCKTFFSNIKRIDVISAKEMYSECMNVFDSMDIIIMSAAIADFTPRDYSESKIKKNQDINSIIIEPTIDILKEMGKKKTSNQILVGFALESDNEINNAIIKIKNKNLDWIVLNSLKNNNTTFNYPTNKVTIIDNKENIKSFEFKPKQEVAIDIIDYIN